MMKSLLTQRTITADGPRALMIVFVLFSLLWFGKSVSPARADGYAPTETPTLTATTIFVSPATPTSTQAAYPASDQQPAVVVDPNANVPPPQPTQLPTIDVDNGTFFLGPLLLLLLALVAFGAIAYLLMRRR